MDHYTGVTRLYSREGSHSGRPTSHRRLTRGPAFNSVSDVRLVLHPGRPSFALVGPRGLVVTVRRAARGVYAFRHEGHRPHQPRHCVRGHERRAFEVATRYARRFA